MLATAGEIDRSLATPELIEAEFERFIDLHHVYTDGDYPSEGLFQERCHEPAVVYDGLLDLRKYHRSLRGLIVPNGGNILVVGTQHFSGHQAPVDYKDSPNSERPYWTVPIVVASHMVKPLGATKHPWGTLEQREYDKITEIGVGVEILTVLSPSGEVDDVRRRVGQYAVTLIGRWYSNGEVSVEVGRTATLDPPKSFPVERTQRKVKRRVPDTAQKDLLQVFRVAAWESARLPE